MSVQLQRNVSMIERGSQFDSLRNDIHISAYEKALLDLAHDKKLERDLAVGRQVGFYRIRGELGSGNFSRVKLGIHILTRGVIRDVWFEKCTICQYVVIDTSIKYGTIF